LRLGDVQGDPGWWQGSCNGLTGVFPSNHVEPVDQSLIDAVSYKPKDYDAQAQSYASTATTNTNSNSSGIGNQASACPSPASTACMLN
jgi:hypothetical protein